jgi:hypothetical protein
MSNYKPFNPEKVTTMFGTHRLRAFGADAMVEVAFNADYGEVHIPVDGEARHVDMLDRSGTITVTLAQHSASNAALTAIVAANVPVPVTIADISSNGDLFFAGSVKIKTMPTFSKGKSNSENVWVWQFTKGRMVMAGAVE